MITELKVFLTIAALTATAAGVDFCASQPKKHKGKHKQAAHGQSHKKAPAKKDDSVLKDVYFFAPDDPLPVPTPIPTPTPPKEAF